RKKLVLPLAVALGAVALAGIAFVATRSEPVSLPAPVEAAANVAAPKAPSAPKAIHLSATTVPPGATVTRSGDSTVLGTTPVALIVALAAPKADPNESAARAAAAEAKTAYEAQDFSKALEKYSQAYSLKQAPRLLFNIAQCHRQLGHHEQAVTFFQRYLDSF